MADLGSTWLAAGVLAAAYQGHHASYRPRSGRLASIHAAQTASDGCTGRNQTEARGREFKSPLGHKNRCDFSAGRRWLGKAGLPRRVAFAANGCFLALDARPPERPDHIVGG